MVDLQVTGSSDPKVIIFPLVVLAQSLIFVALRACTRVQAAHVMEERGIVGRSVLSCLAIMEPACTSVGVASPIRSELGQDMVFTREGCAGLLALCYSSGGVISSSQARRSPCQVDVNRGLNIIGLISLIAYLSLALNSLVPWQCKENPDGSASVPISVGPTTYCFLCTAAHERVCRSDCQERWLWKR
eukprot:6469848-Amphidinium_carterae.1